MVRPGRVLPGCFLISLFLPLGAMGQWTQQPFSYADALSKVRFVDSTTGWIVGDKFIYKTSNGGASWVPQDSTKGGGVVLTALNRDTVFYAGFNNSVPYSRGLRRTLDGGSTWITVDTSQIWWNQVKFVSRLIGYSGGGIGAPPNFRPIVRKTTDGGASWFTSWTGGGKYQVQGMHFLNATHGWIATYDGAFLETTDGGVSWSVRDSTHTQLFLPVRDLAFGTNDSGWAVGGISGTSLIVKTTDGGVHWSSQTFSGSSLREVIFFNARDGWYAGSSFHPYIARTSDGGTTWLVRDQTISVSGVESFSMVNQNLGWAVNRLGAVYKTSNGGIVSVMVGGEEPGSVPALHQNYPNPFNPSTTIRYGLPARLHVTLAVYNTLGQQVVQLVSGDVEAGYYEVKFDASSLPSGVYFYRLQSGSYVETRKLLLLR